jgi:hypothetical protein
MTLEIDCVGGISVGQGTLDCGIGPLGAAQQLSFTLASLKEGAQRESIGLQPTAAAGRTGGETFRGAGCELKLRLMAFRGRRHSDLVGNAALGLLAEYVVAWVL